MKLRLLKLFNSCWHESAWPWNSSRVIFIKKPGKSNYSSSSSYRPLTLSSHVGKLFERKINRRWRTFFTSCKIIEEEQEGFREKRSTVRSLYRMQLELEDVQRNEKPAALLKIDLEKAFDSGWIDGLLYKLQNSGITVCLLNIIQAFLSNRLSFIKIGNYRSNDFPIHIGLPQGSVLSPTLFILFINDFIDTYHIRFKFADHTALILTADDNLQLANRKQAAADDIKRWCDKWRMAVNGSKTEIVLFNYNSNDPFEIALNSDICKVKTSTKSLEVIIDKKMKFKEHAEQSVAKAQRNWAAITSKCTNRWCLSLMTQVYLYRTIIMPQALYGAPLWYHKNTHQLRRLQNNVMRKIFKNGPSPSIQACEALTGVPPIDIYCESIAVKFAIKIRQSNDLVRDTQLKSISKSRSRANSLESSLRRYSRSMNKETILEYTNDHIAGFITNQWRKRWKRWFNNSFLTNLTAPAFNVVSPMICGDSYTANKICEFLIGKSLKLADMNWKLSLCASPMCECGESEETPFHFFSLANYNLLTDQIIVQIWTSLIKTIVWNWLHSY